MLNGVRVILGVTGGIAAYKAVELASLLVKERAIVKTVMTENATEFVHPTTFRAITNQSVVTKMFNTDSPIEHISLADWCDVIVVAPATGNIIGKIAHGIGDDILTTTIMASVAQKIIVPSMNVKMYENAIVQANMELLRANNMVVMQSDKGRLACGYSGSGRFPSVQEIKWYIKGMIGNKMDYRGKKVLITAGACREYFDPMRFISNASTGKMGIALARAAHIRGADVTLIHANVTEEVPYYLNNIAVRTAKEMEKEVLKSFENADYTLMAAAVTDFRPTKYTDVKMKKDLVFSESRDGKVKIEFEQTQDILKQLGAVKREEQILIGFAAETNDILDKSRDKMFDKKCDYFIGNHISMAGRDDSEVLFVTPKIKAKINGNKFEIANKILNRIL